MVQHQVTGLFVCNESQQVVGLLTAWDLIQRTYLSNRHPKQVPIHQVLRSKFTSLAKENVSSSCRALVQRMKRTGEHKVAIVDKESVVLWDVLNLQETIMSLQVSFFEFLLILYILFKFNMPYIRQWIRVKATRQSRIYLRIASRQIYQNID